eukprot:12406593-Alexandrium_andersonii.AAC.1
MSASLVGSEMCIRDRPCLLREGLAPRTLTPASTNRARRPAVRCPRPARCCLLYTSDAADDM